MRTAQAAEILGLKPDQLLQIVHQNEIEVPKDVDRYVWAEAHLDQVRAAIAERRRQREEEASASPQGLSTRQAAERLGLSYEELLVFVREQEIPVPRPGPLRHYAFDETSLGLVRQALAALPSVPEPPRPRGLTTKPAETAFINALPERGHALKTPVAVLVLPLPDTGFLASLAELSLTAEGKSRHDVLRLLRQKLWSRYREVSTNPDAFPDEWTVLRQLIVPRSPGGAQG